VKKYSIDEVCETLGISRQGLNARCRKLGVEKIKEGRRSYITHKNFQILKGGKTPPTPKKDDTERFGGSQTGDERLITRLTDENDYLRKKLDEEGEKVKGSLNVIFQQTERILKLETENNKMLIEHDWSDNMENNIETEWKQKQEFPNQTWWGKLFGKKVK